MRISSTRLLLAGFSLALALTAGGALWDVLRFGTTTDATGQRVERHMRTVLAARAKELTALTAAVTPLIADVDHAIVDRDALPQIFLKLVDITAPSRGAASLTIYSADSRTLAWSDGPAEDLGPDRLHTPPDALFVTEGTLGLRLVHVRALRSGDRLIGVAAAESLLSFAVGGGPERHLAFATPYGDVTLVQPSLSSAGDNLPRPHTFMVTDAAGAALVEVRYDPATIAATRSAFRRAAAAAAASPMVITLLLLAGPWLDRRRHTRTPTQFLGWTFGIAGLLTACTFAVLQLAHVADIEALLRVPAWGLLAAGLCALGPVSWWLRRRPRRSADAAPMRFIAEHIAAGAIASIFLLGLLAFLNWRISATSFDQWQFPLFPLRLQSLLGLAGVLLIVAAATWSAATALAVASERWRVDRSALASTAAVTLWLTAITGGAVALHATGFPVAITGLVLNTVAVVAFGLIGTRVRRRYRHTTQAARLGLLFAMLVAPALAAYAAEDFYAEASARRVIETEYARAVQTAEQPRHLQAELGAAQAEIDAFPGLAEIVNQTPHTPTQAAFTVWSRTRLARDRVTSAIELYDANGTLVSRFALNVPEYGPPGLGERVTRCGWVQSGEAGRFGAEERRMLRGERALCDPSGGPPRGSIVVHLMPDYRALPFVSSDDPYFDVLRPGGVDHASRVADLQVAVYGWGPLTRFASSNVAWAITPALFDRLYQSRQAFWTDLSAKDRNYHVYFSNDRGGIYAVGYPVTSYFEHLTRLAEATTLLFGVFVFLLLGATVFGPFVHRKAAPLRVLVTEVRTSFYRKLFLYFVLAAVGPVVALAFVFGTYMSDKFRADIESEATDVVIVARRVFEELLTLQATAPTDDLLVWIGQAINQDVNLFNGSQLVATSQRDLFDSGLLPTRTPAAVYRSIALNRLPSYTGDDRLGGFSYLIAAAPVPGRGRDTVLSVPLALRQRELAHELDELNRGVLVGAVVVVMLVAALGVYVAGRVSTPVARLTRATRQIAAGRLDVRIVADTADELRRLVDDFNMMAVTLASQRDELARANQLKAWAEMARQVAHEIKNPLTPIQLSAEHLRRVHADQGKPLGDVFEQCVETILRQVQLLRQIAGEFSNYAATPTPHITAVALGEFLQDVTGSYHVADSAIQTVITLAPELPPVAADRTLLARAITNLLENARQAMPSGGTISVTAAPTDARWVSVTVQDSGVGMDATARLRAFEPYFSTKTAGSGLGLPNAKRHVELCGGTLTLDSAPGQGTSITIRLRQAGVAPADFADA